jgi:hypothetical protein
VRILRARDRAPLARRATPSVAAARSESRAAPSRAGPATRGQPEQDESFLAFSAPLTIGTIAAALVVVGGTALAVGRAPAAGRRSRRLRLLPGPPREPAASQASSGPVRPPVARPRPRAATGPATGVDIPAPRQDAAPAAEVESELQAEPEPAAGRPPDEPLSRAAGTPAAARVWNAAPECRVRWWHGYLKSQFYAAVRDADGGEWTVAESPFFRSRGQGPPGETPEAAEALRALVDALEDDGWTAVGRGGRWFALRFRGAEPPAAPGAPAGD